MTTLFYTTTDTPVGKLTLLKTNKGLCALDNAPIEEITNRSWFNQSFKDADIEIDNDAFENELQELAEYFNGTRKTFTFPIDLKGTIFQQSVWRVLQSISYGQTLTYGEVARMIGKRSNAAQAVGQAVGMNPVMIVVPCHRVLSKSGELTGFRGGIQMKEQLLNLEGTSY